MATQTRENADTRGRLLDAARVIFAEKGYHHATIAEICERAGANIAAVNYYFRSKDNLYVQAWREAFARSVAAHPPDGGAAADAPPEDRLRGRIRALIERVADPESHTFDIVRKELANPTGLLAETMHEAIEPIRQGMTGVVEELLGPAAPPEAVRLCEMSVLTQCIHFVMRERFRRSLPEGARLPGPPPLDVDLDTVIDHVFRFSLAGIRHARQQAEADDAANRSQP
jgi:AcrR family transcriptional regulator